MSRMKADESGSSASHRSTASIFKNPFDVEKDQLIRQLFELPVRIAAVVQSCRNQLGSNSADKIESPFSIFAAESTAREEMGARQSVSIKMGDFNETVLKQQPRRNHLIEDMVWSSPNSFCQERIDCAIEARQDNIKEPITYGRKKRKRSEQSPAAPSSLEYACISNAHGCLYIETTSQNNPGELDAESYKSCDNPCTNKPLSVSANDEVFSPTPESKQDEKLVEQSIVKTQKEAGTSGSSQAAEKTRPLAGQNKVVPVKPVSTMKMKSHDAAKFIVMVIRTLRHTRDGNMQKLFEILSIPDFPVEKCNFLEELIHQAHCYNKEGVAKELGKYRSEIMKRD